LARSNLLLRPTTCLVWYQARVRGDPRTVEKPP
jgi:hypothetical protein